MADQDAVWVGIDLGTQSVRVLAVDGSGLAVGSGSEPLASHRDGPRHEQDPEQWWSAVTSASRSALTGVDPARIRGLAVDGTSGTILLADDRGRPLTAGLMYDDGRAGAEVERVNEAGPEIWEALGYRRMQPTWALPKLVWLLEDHPGLRGAGTRLLHQPDVVTWRLIGHQVATDASHALKTGFHLIEERWPTEILAALDVPEGLLPTVVRAGTVLGGVCAAAAAQTGIPEGTTVVAGMTDGCAAQLGAGALDVGAWNSVLGTTLVLKGVTEHLLQDPAGVVYSHRAPDGGWLPGGASSTGAGALTHAFPGRDLDALGEHAASREPAGAVAYPLVSRGERFPFHAPQAEGFVLGEPADEIDHYAAVLQGVAFVERLCFDYLDMLGAPTHGTLSFTGGATGSRYWCQLRSDVLGRSAQLPENAEPVLGMAILAASPGRRVAEVAAEMVRVREVVQPREGRTEIFLEPYLRLVDELARRGWLDRDVAEHARGRAGG